MAREWSEVAVAELIDLTAKGLTSGQISLRIGKTRNSIIGKWRRLGGEVADRFPGSAGRPLIWNPQRVAELRKMWISGYPSREIADKIGMSISAVNHKIAQVMAGPRPRTKKRLPIKQIPQKPQKKHKPFSGKTVSFRDHGDNQCCYVVGDANGADTLYCADERLDGSSYCPEHFALCTTRVMPRSGKPFLLCASNG
jgi:hypothetical protein